MFPTLSFRKTR